MSQVTPRLLRRITSDFPEPGSADEIARLLGEASDVERVQAAIVLAANGDPQKLRHGVELAGIDWRDVLMNGGLEHENWREQLDAELGSATSASFTGPR